MGNSERNILIDYTNHAGVRSVREIQPWQLDWFSTEWHPQEQWFLNAYDVAKDDMRTFAVKDIHRWGVEPGKQMEVDLSLAAQLQWSMERNARMVNRLQKLAASIEGEADGEMRDLAYDMHRICKDEDPA